MKHGETMTFTEIDKLKAMAIVHIFETSRPFGDYAAYAVLNDGAGVSYGINQVTHRSGSLAAVVKEYLAVGGSIGHEVLEDNFAILRSASSNAIRLAAGNRRLERALKAAAATFEMRAAQHAVAFERYLQPAIAVCEGSRFTTPLALAVIYDSINHGSWERIRHRVLLPAPTGSSMPGFEKAWITEYVGRRHKWLRSLPRLRSTDYRTAFFLSQIAQHNWDLELPFFVHGVALNKEHFLPSKTAVNVQRPDGLKVLPQPQPEPSIDDRLPERAIPANPAEGLDRMQERVDAAAAAYDQFETIVRTVLKRTDAAKSLWTTVVGTIWQSLWAVVSFVIGLPVEIWLVVALIAAVLILFYLYRQLALGKIRESAGLRHTTSRSPGEKI
ncbi:MAG: chitosanase [Pyrinomonadaceae bacterium]